MKDNKIICSECGAILTNETAHEFEGKTFCSECLERVTTTCECCGTRIWNDEAQGDSNIVLCNRCYEYNYSICEDCGRVIHNDNAYYFDDSDYPYCYECFQKLESNPIKSYNYKPEPIFYGSGSLFMGIELEIDNSGI